MTYKIIMITGRQNKAVQGGIGWFQFIFKMMPRRPGGSDARILLRMSRSIPTQPTKEALE